MAQALRTGYKELFERNEYAQDLSKEKLKNLVAEITGRSPGDSMVGGIVGTFENLKRYASWEAAPAALKSKRSRCLQRLSHPRRAVRQ